MTAIDAMRSSLAERRTARTDRRRLERELARFTTDAERAELDAMLRRHPSEDTLPIRRILADQDRLRARARQVSAGHLAA
jgi:hypothetical protein